MDAFVNEFGDYLLNIGLPEWLVAFLVPALKILGAVGVLIIGFWVAGFVGRKIKHLCDKTDRIDDTVTPLIVQIVRYAIIFTAFLTVFGLFGIDTTSIIAVLGSLGLAVGLAMQGALTNVASGIMLVTLRPFNVGDTVEVAGQMGTVEVVGLFYTKLNTLDGVHVVMPNSQIWGSEIKNYSRNDKRRMNLKFGIGYNDNIDKAYEIIKRVYGDDSRILKEPAPTVAVTELADSSVNMIAYAWTKNSDWWDTQLDIVKKVKEAFDKEGISIPFPQLDVHVNNNK
ncbi:MAG TPA: mechanosensitive ion channel [Caldisericia bacterium]|nr:mechanosensitive ion channel [Caldisericia bacterium]HPF48712.1 mechanosensitive ion channel [Caldisericia bacterium]HPI83628.1 mechanosensitive ion channel [Caldisericia bacterium]HPQ93167.1 mechanosensitive ion channel [Caldisericia bacterium]HRV75000.1 mechanosensitive ion channel [Caldisericia bacterium]